MKSSRPLLPALACAIALSACQPTGSIATTALEQAKQGLEQANQGMAEAQEIDEARNKLATENLSLDHGHKGNGSLPKRRDHPVRRTAHRQQAVPTRRNKNSWCWPIAASCSAWPATAWPSASKVPSSAHECGQQRTRQPAGRRDPGEDIGKEAERVARETIKPQVEKLCARLPELLKSQQALAAALPAFRPYAGMTQSDVDGCMDKRDFDF